MRKGKKSKSKTRKELMSENKELLHLLTRYKWMLNSMYGSGSIQDRFNIQKLTSVVSVPYPTDSLGEEYLKKEAEAKLLCSLKDYILTGKREIINGELCIGKYIYVYKKEDE